MGAPSNACTEGCGVNRERWAGTLRTTARASAAETHPGTRGQVSSRHLSWTEGGGGSLERSLCSGILVLLRTQLSLLFVGTGIPHQNEIQQPFSLNHACAVSNAITLNALLLRDAMYLGLFRALATRSRARVHHSVPHTIAKMSTELSCREYPAYKATFPGSPRAQGVAKVTVGGAAPAGTTVVHFLTKEELAGKFTGLAAADAERDSVHVRYEVVGGVETRVLYASLGAANAVNLGAVQRASNAAVSKLRALKVTSAELVAPVLEAIPAAKVAEGLVQAAALTNFHFDRYLTSADKIPTFLSSIHVTLSSALSGEDAAAAVASGRAAAILAECTIFARDMCNERSDEMHPGRVEEVARTVAAEIGAEVYVLAGDGLVKEGLHLLYSVGQAAGVERPATHAPRYVELAYRGDPANPTDVILVVGKCITYDTGGLNIKGTGFMEDMHMDKGGASAVMGAMLALHRLGVKRNVVGGCARVALDGARQD